MFNNYGERNFITTQSIKKLNEGLKNWCLDPTGWKLEGSDEEYDISALEDSPEERERIYYKQRLLEGYDEDRDIDFDQNLIVTFSMKYRIYQQTIRNRQVERAAGYISEPSSLKKRSQNDARRFVMKTSLTKDGEVEQKDLDDLDEAAIAREAQ